jgi:hypothetical protein
MNEDLIEAFGQFNDAAYAMQHTQIANASAAAERLEAARQACYALFMQAVKREVTAGRDGS